LVQVGESPDALADYLAILDDAKGDVRKQLSDHLTEILSPELTSDGELTIDRLCD
jgi:hypothetical protein